MLLCMYQVLVLFFISRKVHSLPLFGLSRVPITTPPPTTTPAPTTSAALTPPPQIAKYVGLNGLYQQFKDVNDNTAKNTAGAMFTIGLNSAAFGTNLLNEMAKLSKLTMNSAMDSQTDLLDALIGANTDIEAGSEVALNGTHRIIKNSLDKDIHQWDLVTDMFQTGAQNAVSNGGGGSSSINIKTNFG